MKKSRLLLLLGLTSCMGGRDAISPAIPQDPEMEKKIEQILSHLTLTEKVGQMCQLTATVINNPENTALSQEKMDEVFGKYKVGSILNIPFGVGQPKEVWSRYIEDVQQNSLAKTGLPTVYGVDQIHGASYTVGATLFPQGINMAATFNRELARKCAEIGAYETRACGIPWTFSPVVDLGRDPRWPRMWENYGEDPYVSAQMGLMTVKGYQGDEPNHIDAYHVAACMKHYMGYGVPTSGKDRTPAAIPEAVLREKHFAPFKEAVRNGALTIMVNSASVNGLPVHANKELLTGWLKEGLNWDGMIVTDWNDINNLYEREHIATSKKDAVRLAINAGIDMAMTPFETQFCTDLVELVEEKKVPLSRIDDAVRRILRLKFRLGLFNQPTWDTALGYDRFACEEFAQTSLEAAIESEVLLKNEKQLLPLKKETRILLTGPNANSMRCLNGGWSYSWSGDRADEFAQPYHTIYEALRNTFGADQVMYEPGVTWRENGNWWEEKTPEIGKAVAAASRADVIVACIGENSYCETPGNLDDLHLSRNQVELIQSLSRTGKPIILILNEGRPRLVHEIEPLAEAVVDILLPSNYGGDALALLLSGQENFSGRLPFTYPRYANSLTTYDFKVSEQVSTMAGQYNYSADIDIQWPFGYGLSYTQFRYSNFQVDRKEFTAEDELTFTIDVENVGSCKGKEAVLLYSSDLVASSIPDAIRLRNFEKVELEPVQKTRVSMVVKASDLAFVGLDGKWRLEEGDFTMRCGTEQLNIHCFQGKVWEEADIL